MTSIQPTDGPGEATIDKTVRFLRLIVGHSEISRMWQIWLNAEGQLSKIYRASLSCFQVEDAYLLLLEGPLAFIYTVISLFLPAWEETQKQSLEFELVISPTKWMSLTMNNELVHMLKDYRTEMYVSQHHAFYPGQMRIVVRGSKESVIWPLINIVNISGIVEVDPAASERSVSVSPRLSSPAVESPTQQYVAVPAWNHTIPVTPVYTILPQHRPILYPPRLPVPGTVSPNLSSTPFYQACNPSPLEIFQALSSLMTLQNQTWTQKPSRRRNNRPQRPSNHRTAKS